MSLAAISGKVSSITNGGIGRAINSAITGGHGFLRNNAGGLGSIGETVNALASTFSSLLNAAGYRSNMYKIGEIAEDGGTSKLGKLGTTISSKFSTAVSYWTGVGNGQTGIIIDGFDNFKGDIGVALAEQPVMYKTPVSDNRVRNPNRLTMRVYVDLVHSDDALADLVQQVKDGLGGAVGSLIGLATGDTMNRAQKALNNLQWIQENGEPFKVYTPHKTYDNMMIESINPVNDIKNNEMLCADITFKEIIYCKPLQSGYATPARLSVSKKAAATAETLGWVNNIF